MSNHGTNTTAVSAPSLNVYKKVSVIREPNDRLTYEDVEGKLQSVTVKDLGDAMATAVRKQRSINSETQHLYRASGYSSPCTYDTHGSIVSFTYLMIDTIGTSQSQVGYSSPSH